MSDEDDIPSRVNVPKLSDHPANRANEQSTIHGAPKLDSKQSAIDWVDQNYALTWIGNVLRVINERYPDNIIPITKKDFIDSIENVRIVVQEEDKPKITPVSELWLKWPNRRMYEQGMIFNPREKFDSKTMRTGAYNTWPGFAIEPRPGSCPLFLAYLKDIICNGNDKHYHWLM